MANKTIIDKTFNGDFSVVIKHQIFNYKFGESYELITPVVEDGVKWETERQGSPGKLTFKVCSDKNNELNFQEGDAVALKYHDNNKGWIVIFSGYVFTKKTNKDGWIDVTAYDQLRYFKNKATYVYTNKKASDIVKMIINDYKLGTGTIEDTSYVIGSRVEDNQSLFDIIQNALDQTIASTNELYVLYAENSGICLRNAKNMKTDVIISDVTAKDFEYTSTIDEDVYNDIELFYDNDETNKREYYHATDTNNMNNWGRLRYTESIQNPTNAQDRANKMLTLYNRKNRKLQVKDAFGDYRCRAGASVIAQLDLGDTSISNYMLIEKATHTFKKGEYRMDLTLSDKEFSV